MGVPVQSGDVLAAKYQVERVLGEGGMGVVVAARHLQLGQMVALKFLKPEAVLQGGDGSIAAAATAVASRSVSGGAALLSGERSGAPFPERSDAGLRVAAFGVSRVAEVCREYPADGWQARRYSAPCAALDLRGEWDVA